MNKKLASLFYPILVFVFWCNNLSGQNPTSIFESCTQLDSKADIKSCEKIVILNFIYKEFFSYAKTVKKSGQENELWMFFTIEPTGEINEFEIREKSKSESFGHSTGIPLGKPYKPVLLPDFIGNKKIPAQYKLPLDLVPDFDYDWLYYKREQEIFKVVEHMPRFPGCDELDTEKEKDECSKNKMLEYIYKQLKYPEEAKKNKVEGTVVLQFVIEDNGYITEIKVVRDIGSSCGQAAMEVVESMNRMSERWTPGSQRNRKVAVLYLFR